jgi:toluene monooxygenase system protein E
MAQQKTYWHLMQQRRMPSEYEIVTSKLLCYTDEGFTGKTVRTRRSIEGLVCAIPGRFSADVYLLGKIPRSSGDHVHPVYRTADGEGDLRRWSAEEIEVTGYDAELPAHWLHILSRMVAPFRYPGHSLAMIAAYFGQMAPSGRLTITGGIASGGRSPACGALCLSRPPTPNRVSWVRGGQ